MRRIMFRGKPFNETLAEEDGYIYGQLVQWNAVVWQIYVIEPSGDDYRDIAVYPKSVGQCTDIEDDNGVMLYEGDKILCGSPLTAKKIIFNKGKFCTGSYGIFGWKSKTKVK